GEVLPAIRKTGGYGVSHDGITLPHQRRRAPVLGRSAATNVNLDLAESSLGRHELRVGCGHPKGDASGDVRA
ncbi:hypothetical protein, partial [Magnetospirillum aberrantis]|uniref:hypothetical protein n=1 Tax=Magnetospirillum aberrantis TaxID=1105283 RepID=UPI00197C505F